MKSGLGRCDWHAAVFDIAVLTIPESRQITGSQRPVNHDGCIRASGVRGNDTADTGRQSKSHVISVPNGLSVEELETLPVGTSQGHHKIYRLQGKAVERGSGQRYKLKRVRTGHRRSEQRYAVTQCPFVERQKRKVHIHQHAESGTVSKALPGKLLRDGVEHTCAFPGAYIPS